MACWFLAKKLAFKDPPSLKFHDRTDINIYRYNPIGAKLKFCLLGIHLGAEYLVFVSSRSLKTKEKYTNWDNLVRLSLYIFWAQSYVYFYKRKYFLKVNIDYIPHLSPLCVDLR